MNIDESVKGGSSCCPYCYYRLYYS